MRRLALAVVLLSSCLTRSEPPPPPLPLPTLAEVRAGLVGRRPLPPDRRVLRAVSELHHLLTGTARSETTAVFVDGRFTLHHGGKAIGSLPLHADYGTLKKVLVDWIAAIGKPLALPALPLANDEEPPLDRDAFALLAEVQGTWSTAPTRRALHDANRALVGLAVSTSDDLDLAEELLARALATCVLDQESHASAALREEALIAYWLGYRDAARALGPSLAAGDPVRALVTDDDEGLTRSSGLLANVLQLTRVTVTGSNAPAPPSRRRALASHALDPSVLGGRLGAADDADGRVAEALLATAVLDAADDARATGTTDAAIDKARIDLDALRRSADPDVSRVRVAVYGWLGLQREDALIRLERDLARVGNHDVGPFLDRSVRRAILSARAVTALRWFSFHRDDATFRAEVGTGSGPLAMALRAWHGPLAAARAHVLDEESPFATPLDTLGPLAAYERLQAVDADGPGHAGARREARWIFERLDGRPAHGAPRARLAVRLGAEPATPPAAHGSLGEERPRWVATPDPALAALLSAGKFVEAELWARKRGTLLPAAEAAALIAETQWHAGNHEGAARTLTQLGNVDRRAGTALRRAFLEVFGTLPSKGDPGPGLRATKALIDAAVSPSVLRELAAASAIDGHLVVAEKLYAVVLAAMPPSLVREDVRLEQIALTFRARRAHGQARPVADPSPFDPWLAPLAYEYGVTVVAREVVGPPEVQELGALLSVATRSGVVAAKDPGVPAVTILSQGRTRFAALGRHLLGIPRPGETEETLRHLPTSARERCEVAYYLAVSAHLRGDADATTIWLQLALDEGTPEVPEWRWAGDRTFAREP